MKPSIQRRERTSARPPFSSARKFGTWPTGCGSRAGSRSLARNRALTTNVAASIAIAAPGLSATISTPASAGPSTPPTFCASPISEFACCSSAAGTSAGIRPPAAGRKNDSNAP